MNRHYFRKSYLPFAITAALLMLCTGRAHAEPQPQAPAKPESESTRLFKQIQWVAGPRKVQLGDKAELDLPAGYHFTGIAGARLFDESNQNPPGGNELGVIVPDRNGRPARFSWCILFDYSDAGHVNDDEKNSLNDEAANAVLESISKGTERTNEECARRGWATLKIGGWEQKPFYDQATHHITWAVRVIANLGKETSTNVNYNSRILGREGVISANLITDPQSLPKIVPTYNSLVTNMSYVAGHRYSEFRSGDKVAKYGLIGLMTGGAAVVAVKAWKPLIKLGAIVVAAFAGLLAKVKSWFKGKAT